VVVVGASAEAAKASVEDTRAEAVITSSASIVRAPSLFVYTFRVMQARHSSRNAAFSLLS
jgi:hypothetical protein